MRETWTENELAQEKLQADMILVESVMHDRDYRKKNPEHRCDSWFTYENGKWFCKHLVNYRQKKMSHMMAQIWNDKVAKFRERYGDALADSIDAISRKTRKPFNGR